MDGIDLDRPNVARIYDYYLGGNANYAVDRIFGETALTEFPFVRPAARANRLFLHRAVRYLVKQGVRQFVDVGSGVPTIGGSVHQMADELVPNAKVVYVDNEPIAVVRTQMLLEHNGDDRRHAVIQADLREPELLWHKVQEAGALDLRQPVALLLTAVIHLAQPGPDGTELGPAAVAELRELLPAGSYLAVSHGTDDGVPAHLADQLAEFGKMYETTATRVIWRSRAEIEALFGDFEMVEPGATWTPLWHPEEYRESAYEVDFAEPGESAVWAGLAHKP
jgi:hypothetical protein